MTQIFEFFAKRHLLANLITVMILLIGGMTIMDINRSQFPKVDLGTLVISTHYPGASPEDVELNVTNKLEDELKGVVDVRRVVSTSMENVSIISVVLEADATDSEKTKNEIREAVARVSDFPEEVTESPTITDIKTSIFPIVEVGISSDSLPYKELRENARLFEKKLKDIPGIASIKRYGYRAREVKVEVSPDKINEYQIPMREIIMAVQSRNVRATGGSLESYTSEKNVVTLAQFRDPVEVGNVIVRSTFEGPQIRVKDLAVVSDDFTDATIIPKMNGKKAISFLINKAENADVIETVDAIKKLVMEEKENMPEDIEFLFTNDVSKNVRKQFDIVKMNGLIGLALVLLVLALFLNIRTSFWVAMGIPLTLFGVIILLPYYGVDLDSITLTAMIIVIGIVVDDAIIISENIYRRRELGDSPLDAAVNGLREVALPVITTVLTTLLAFGPMFFMGGMLGKFVYVIPLTITLALILSLFESFFILPAHLIKGFKDKIVGSVDRNWFEPVKILFEKVLYKFLKLRYFVILISLSVLGGSLWYGANYIDFVLFPTSGADSFFARIELPIGTSLEATIEKTSEIEKLIEDLPKGEVESYAIRNGAYADLVDSESENYATLAVNLTPYSSRDRTADEIVEAVRAESDKLQGYKNINYMIQSGGPPTGSPVTVQIVGSNDIVRKQLTDSVEAFLKNFEGMKDINRDDKAGKEQVEIKLNYQKLARLGLTVADIAQNVRIAYDGQVVTSIRYGDEDVAFRIMLNKTARKRLSYLNKLQIPNRQGRLIPLSEVAFLQTAPGPSTIRHYKGERSITINGEVFQDITTPQKATNAVVEHFDLVNDYPGMRFNIGGQAQESEEAMIDLMITFGIAAIGIYFLLILLFNSVTQPFLVILAVPFGISGVVIAFALHNTPFSFLAMTGVIGMAGVVVNDSLVLVAHLNELKKQMRGTDILKIIAKGTTNRLRAIILTTLSTVAGLLPLAYGIGGQDVYMAPMALALGFGLLFATPLTLFLIPSLYGIGQDITNLFSKKKIQTT